MAKWEERDARRASETQKEAVAELRGRMSSDEAKSRKQTAEMTAVEAVKAGITHRG